MLFRICISNQCHSRWHVTICAVSHVLEIRCEDVLAATYREFSRGGILTSSGCQAMNVLEGAS